MHAAGVVISQKSVDEYVPLSRAADGSVTTQFTICLLYTSVFDECKAEANWNMKNFIEDQVELIRRQVGDKGSFGAVRRRRFFRSCSDAD